MPARSLYQTAVHWLVRNKDGIDDVGDISYEKIRPVLLKVDRPEQLASIEENSPHLLGKTAEIWRAFLLRDVQDYDRNPVEPKDGKSWWKTYRKAKRRADEEQQRQEEELVSQLTARREEREQNTTTISTKMVVPRPDRKKAKQGMTHARTADSSRLNFGGGTRTKTTTGAGVMKQVKREMAERQTRLHSLGMVPQRNLNRPRPATGLSNAKPLSSSNPARPVPRPVAVPDVREAPRTPHRALPPSRNPRLMALASGNNKPTPSSSPAPPSKSKQLELRGPHNSSSPSKKARSPSPADSARLSPPKKRAPPASVFMPAKRKK